VQPFDCGGFRALPLILIFLVIPIQLYLRCINLCKDFEARENALGCGRKFRLLFHNYDKVRILNNEGQSYAGLQGSFLLFVGTALSVITNFATIRACQIFPWYLYVVCPSLSILILLIIQLPRFFDTFGYSSVVKEPCPASSTVWDKFPCEF
jgi:hypothetical protein